MLAPAVERNMRLLRPHASVHRGKIRLQILRYHMMHYHDGSFFVQGGMSPKFFFFVSFKVPSFAVIA